MSGSLLVRITDYFKCRRMKSKRYQVLVGLAILVFLCTVYVLMVPGITMEEVLICQLEEHSHSSECYEADSLSCELEEHVHSVDCYGTESERETVLYIIDLIDELPTVSEMNEQIAILSDGETGEVSSYRETVITDATKAYSYYVKLDEKLQRLVINNDKLIEYLEAGLIEEVEDDELTVALLDDYYVYGVETTADTSNDLTALTAADGVADTKDFIYVNN